MTDQQDPSRPTPVVRRKRPFRERVRRQMRHRFVIPLKRSRHPPEYSARSASVGLFWALTPTVGIQMAIVLVHWWVSRRFLRKDFSVVYAMAWTWLTNVFTLLPFYYLFYVTGQMMLMRSDISGYDSFVALWDKAMSTADANASAVPMGELISTWATILFKDWFGAMMLGSLPYACVGAWLGWRWVLAAVRAYRRVKMEPTA